MGIFKSKNSKNKDKTTFKLEGDELAKELERVKQESSEFKGEKVEIQDKKEKPKKLTQFKYVVKASNGEKIKGVFDAETQDDVRIFLVNGGYEIVSIAPVSKLELNINIGSNKIKNNDLAFSISSFVHPYRQKSVPTMYVSFVGVISACNVIISSNPTFDAVFNVIVPYFDFIFTFTLWRYNVANASFSPTPNLPINLSLLNFSSFSFWVK